MSRCVFGIWTGRDALPSLDPSLVAQYCAHIKPVPASEYHSRQSRLLTLLLDGGDSDWIFIAEPGPTAAYYANISSSAWHTSERPLLLAMTPRPCSDLCGDASYQLQLYLLTPAFEAARARDRLVIPTSSQSQLELIEWEEHEDPYKVLHRKIARSNKPIMVDDQARLFVAQGLDRAGWNMMEVPDELRQIRERKSDVELEIMRCVNEVRGVLDCLSACMHAPPSRR